MADVEIGPFVDAGMDVYELSHEGLTALWYAVYHANQENVDRLLDHGAEINITDKNGKTLTMLATEQYDLDTLKHLASRGANLYAKDKRGNTVLMYGVYTEDQLYEVNDRYYEIDGDEYSPLEWLLQQGLDTGIANADGETVLQRAIKEDDERSLAVLKAHGVVG